MARELLSEKGVIFISIDDNEQAQLKLLCDQIFGEGNFVNQIIWRKKYGIQNDAKHFSTSHEYIICYAKNIEFATINQLSRTEKHDARYKNPDKDPRGEWTSGDLSVGRLYQRRWKVEEGKWVRTCSEQSLATTEFHKSLKPNLSLEKSPTKNKVSQNNHIIFSIVAFFKLELLTKTSHFKNHFQLKQSILLKALQVSYQELGRLRLDAAGCGG